MQNKLFRFSDIFKETIWGGKKILPYKGLASDDRQIGESWELSGIADHESIVVGGAYDGLTLSALIDKGGAQLLGKSNYCHFGNNFPLLVKFIDATQALSVQVHPTDALARQRHGCPGKTEMWYVVDSTPDAYLLSGFNHDMTQDEYVARVANNTLADALRRYNVHPHDVFFLPAGQVHSIGAGCFICEIQQSSDITYRIYDFGRLDSQGKPRKLHTKEAIQAINFHLQPPELSNHIKDNQANEIVQCSHFTTNAFHLTQPLERDYTGLDSFTILICTKGKCQVACGEESNELTKGHTMLIAAEAKTIKLTPEPQADILESYV